MARILVLLSLTLAALPGIATAAPGDFDESFGGSGIVPSLNGGAGKDRATCERERGV